MADGGEKGGDATGTVGKALRVLDAVSDFGRPVRFGELLDQSPFPKATLYRFLQTLTAEGMLAYDPDRQTYAPGLRLVRLAHAAWAQASLAPIARPHLDRLSADLGETVHLAQLDAAQVLYVDKRNARDPIPMFSSAGKVGPAYCTGVGKAMMAFLPEPDLDRVIAQQSFHRFTPNTLCTADALREELAAIRARGYAFDREEHEPGIICVAFPVLTGGQRVLGAVSVTSSTQRTSLAALEGHAPAIARTAAAVAQEATSWRFPETGTA
ncbi:helix-turn-helix domain-containing protein [Rhodobacterales bacterium HKCCE3408]|nr:helix-turn-helix domain-containing protein [Rhodobacterales bacterium HKCCE3408]